jgi:hydrogenase-4 component E
MITLLIVLFMFSLFYISMAERFRVFASLIAVQGVLLFGIAILELQEMNLANLVFVVSETLLFKAIAVPVLMYRIILKTQVFRVHPKTIPGFYLLLMAMAGLIISILLAKIIQDKHTDVVFTTAALFTLIVGILIIVTHRRIFSHMVGFLVIENAVFLFSLAVGSETPFLVNIGILLDIVVSVLILTVFIGRIGEKFNDLETESLTDLRH